MALITVPDFEFSGIYYPELIEDLIQYMRTACPEITDEDPAEPFIQLLRANALIGHLNNVLLDLTAKERFLATLSLRESLRSHLALIDYQLKQATPAQADIIVQLSQTFAAAMTPLYAAGATVATPESSSSKSIQYQTLADFNLTNRSDRLTACYAFDSGAQAYTDHTAAAQNASGFTPGWGGASAVNDLLYIGHTDVMWDAIRLVVATPQAGFTGVWEYFDGSTRSGGPDLVTNNGANITFNINSFLGTANRTGAIVRVKCSATGAFEDCTSTWNGSTNQITTTGILGQSVVSTSVAAYVVTADWQELEGVADATANFSASGTGDVTFTLPQTVLRKWQLTTVNGLSAFWIRFRVVVAGSAAPTLTSATMATGHEYVTLSVTQGATQADNPLGSSNGQASQSFQLQQFPVIDDSNLAIYVTEGGVETVWTRVTDFLSSGATDTNYTVDFDDNGIGSITFGDGINGKIPNAGNNNIRATYRTMDDQDGGVGQNTITVNKSGLPYANSVYNPRAANGYAAREGSTDADIARLKVAGPATLRTKNRALTSDDVVSLTTTFVAADGSKPFARALAIEESFGPKTVEVVVVGQGGVGATAAQLQALQDYFNGNASSGIKGVLVQNNQATPTNYVPHVINIVATVYGGDATFIKNALSALLSPTSVQADGVTYTWNFGGSVPLAQLIATVMGTSPAPRNVVFATPAADVALATRELPVVGTISLTMLP